MKENLTEIVAIIDRSGSMGNMTSDVIGGMNQFIKSQKSLEGEARFSLFLFDNVINHVYDQVPLVDIPDFDETTYFVGGSTAMYDAIGYAINHIGGILHKTDESERPSKVLFCIMTDGADNSSNEFNAKNIKDMIQHQTEKYSWEFVFMAANINVQEAADAIGIRNGSSFAFDATSDGMKGVYDALSNYTTSYRSSK